jgi:hypothetical protein
MSDYTEDEEEFMYAWSSIESMNDFNSFMSHTSGPGRFTESFYRLQEAYKELDGMAYTDD